MGLSLTWERGSKIGREASREKSVLREICRGAGRQWRRRRSSECRKENEGKTEGKKGKIKEEVEKKEEMS